MSDQTTQGAARYYEGVSYGRRLPKGQPRLRCIFAYHEILPEQARYAYRVSTAQFLKHLELFATLRHRLPGSTMPQPVVEITFDDGHCSNALHAMPMLDAAGQKATFFVLAGCIGQTSGALSWEQVSALVASGHDVQSHGWSHRLLTQCTPKDLQRELVYSKKTLEDHLGREITAITAPGGRWDMRVLIACGKAGYQRLYHSNPWLRSGVLNGVEFCGRLMVTGAMNAKDLARTMNLNATERLLQRARYAIKDATRSTLGDHLYHKLWCSLSNFDSNDGIGIEITAQPLLNRRLEQR